MNKENLNRRFGNPEKRNPFTPLDLFAAAHLISEYCNSADLEECKKCIFHDSYAGCHLLLAPEKWDLSVAKDRTNDWINEQLPKVPYLDTDKYTDK